MKSFSLATAHGHSKSGKFERSDNCHWLKRHKMKFQVLGTILHSFVECTSYNVPQYLVKCEILLKVP